MKKFDCTSYLALKEAIVHSIKSHADRLFVTFHKSDTKKTEEKDQRSEHEKYVDWTYSQLGYEVSRIIKIIQSASLPGSRVSLMFSHDGLTYAAMLACVLTDRTFVPLNLRQPHPRLKQIIELTESNLLLTDHFWNDKSFKIFENHNNLKIINVESDLLDHSKLAQLPCDISFENSYNETEFPVYILFTSGSTGQPKGVMVSHKNLFSYLSGMMETFKIFPEDRLTQQFEVSFDSGIGEIFHGILSGASLHPLRSFEIPFIRNYIQRVQPTVWGGTPSMLGLARQILKPTDCYQSVRLSFFMGERLSHESVAYWKKIFPNTRIFNLYGPTETTINVLFHEWSSEEATSVYGVPLGKPIGSNQISIMNDAGLPAQPGEAGEIFISGRQVTMGYLATSEAENTSKFQSLFFENGVYRSGDFAILKDGLIYFIGRKDDQIKVRGFRLDLNEVEFYARQSLADTSVIAFLIQSDQQAGIGLLLDQKIDTASICALVENLRANLPSYAVPLKIYFAQKWPLSATDKIDRSKINADFLSLFAMPLDFTMQRKTITTR